MSLRRTKPVIPPGTVVLLPSGRRVRVQGARSGGGVEEPELRCCYVRAPADGDQQNVLWLTQRFVLVWGSEP